MEEINSMSSLEQKQELRTFFSKQYRRLVNSFQGRYRDMSQMEVEDVVSDLMTDLLGRTDVESQIENIGAYIYRSVQNRIIDYLRRRKKMFSLDQSPYSHDNENTDRKRDIFAVEYNIDTEIDSTDIRLRLLAALDVLKPAQRAVWIATELDGYHFRELAEMWDTPLGTLLARKHRANAALQRQLHDLKKFL